MQQIKYLIRKEGTDAWWKLPIESFLTPAVLKSVSLLFLNNELRILCLLLVW